MTSTIRDEPVTAKLVDYEKTCRGFVWELAESEFTWSRTGRLNIVHEAIDRWAACPRNAGRTALIWDDGIMARGFCFAEMRAVSCRWANMLAEAGLQAGGRLLTLLPPGPEAVWAQLAAARLGAAYCHLRPGYSAAVYRSLLARLRPDVILTASGVDDLPWDLAPAHCAGVFLRGNRPGRLAREFNATQMLSSMSDRLEPVWVPKSHTLQIVHAESPEGPPKLAYTDHGAMNGLLHSARWALNLGPESVLLADGHTSGAIFATYGVWGAWLNGATSLLLSGQFTPERWRGAIKRHKVSVWYTMPSFIRGFIAAGDRPELAHDFKALEHIATVGQQLEAEDYFWSRNNFGRPPHDTWWTVETGMISVANFPSMDIKLGSIGRPLPGMDVRVIDGVGRPAHLLTIGDLAVRAPWPAMARGLLDDEQTYRQRFRFGGWLISGDMAAYDEDGYIYLQGRRDDLIRGVGRVVGPFEVEQALNSDPRVAEAAAVASSLPDGQPALKAFVQPAPGQTPDEDLRQALLAMLAGSISPDGPLSGLEFLAELPKNAQGRLIRRALRALDLGLPVGNVSNLLIG